MPGPPQHITFVDPEGGAHNFYVVHDELMTTHVLVAVENVEGGGGYKFGAHGPDEETAMAKLRVEVARGLATRYLDGGHEGPRLRDRWVAGTIEPTGLVIDGKFFTPDEFQAMLYWRQGSWFRMEVGDIIEALHPQEERS